MRIDRGKDARTLRRILTAMILDKIVAARIAGQWPREGLFDSSHANLIGGWAVRHVRKHSTAIGRNVEIAYEHWMQRREKEDDLSKSVAEFLSLLSDEYEQEANSNSSEYMIDLAGKYFDRVRLQEQLRQAEADLEAGQIDEAYQRLHHQTRVELGVGSVAKPSEDYSLWRKAFDPERMEPLVTYPGLWGKLLDGTLVRDGFLGIMASDKMGKSYYLLDMAVRAVQQHRRVAYFECGDLGQDDVILRLGQRVTMQPLKPTTVRMPAKGAWLSSDEPEMDEVEKDALNPQTAYKRFQGLCRGKDMFRLSCHLNSSISVEGIESILDGWEREEWVPDLVIVDYADILAPPAGVRDTLDQIDTAWKQLRRVAQRWHCLVITATQANADAYKSGGPLRRRNFGGRKTKLAHVSGLLGISRKVGDEKRGVSRLGWIVTRNRGWSEGVTIPIAGCWDVGCPFLRPFVKPVDG